MDRDTELLGQVITALTSAYIVLAETLHEKQVLHKNELAEALALIPDRLSANLQGDVAKAILGGIQGALVAGLKPDLESVPKWLRIALQRRPRAADE